ncbi:MAG: hypothetical protein A2Z72_00040 [Omnitrophica bacterium RBG_13_46_9]|nr:MAG: hypothetical protein A2Z72_00040 [Omnitrophica bacterium RBG_13_46_9]
MVYRTIIEILADAKDKNDAIDTAGEFLRGNLDCGIKMRCHAAPLKPYRLIRRGALSFLVLFVSIIGMVSATHISGTHIRPFGVADISACQPPLKTSDAPEFKKAWLIEENKKTVENTENK